mmetsp:Transcript_7825/g.20016  ORF Transcript_7825/g.20016 Transcript_7825/m.20016 type:complete len:246 (+) Transcript_7825:828-1565(+)
MRGLVDRQQHGLAVGREHDRVEARVDGADVLGGELGELVEPGHARDAPPRLDERGHVAHDVVDAHERWSGSSAGWRGGTRVARKQREGLSRGVCARWWRLGRAEQAENDISVQSHLGARHRPARCVVHLGCTHALATIGHTCVICRGGIGDADADGVHAEAVRVHKGTCSRRIEAAGCGRRARGAPAERLRRANRRSEDKVDTTALRTQAAHAVSLEPADELHVEGLLEASARCRRVSAVELKVV